MLIEFRKFHIHLLHFICILSHQTKTFLAYKYNSGVFPRFADQANEITVSIKYHKRNQNQNTYIQGNIMNQITPSLIHQRLLIIS